MHEGEIGHGVVVGPTRKGKSALMAFMVMQFLRYPDAQVFLFDKDYALYCATLMAGGSHYDLGARTTRGFHVLGRINASDEEQRWAQTWIIDLFEAQGLSVTPTDKEEIWHALHRVAQQPSHLRTLSTFAQCFQVQRLKPGLTAFIQGDPYSFFDAAEDSFQLDWCKPGQDILAISAPCTSPDDIALQLHHALVSSPQQCSSIIRYSCAPLLVWSSSSALSHIGFWKRNKLLC
jgi:type IV secretory pathway VirB4 component